MNNETKPDVRNDDHINSEKMPEHGKYCPITVDVKTPNEAQPDALDERVDMVEEEELLIYLSQYRQALYQLNQFIQQNTLGTLMLSEAVGLDKDAPYGGLDLYLIPKDPSLYAKPSLVNLVRSTNLFNIWQSRAPDQPLPQFDWSKLEYPRFGPFRFYIGSHKEV